MKTLTNIAVCEILFTRKQLKASNGKQPTFTRPESVQYDNSGISVTTVDEDGRKAYFYPRGTYSRVKLIFS